MTNSEYQSLYDEVENELVTPEWRRKLQLLTEHAGDPIAAELAEARKEVARLTADRDDLARRAGVLRDETAFLRRLLGEACSHVKDDGIAARIRREGGI